MIKILARLAVRPDLKYPPTAVGGITDRQLMLHCRLHLNNPPITIGGIKGSFRRRRINLRIAVSPTPNRCLLQQIVRNHKDH